MAKYEVLVTRTTTRETKMTIEATAAEFASSAAVLEMQAILDGEDPDRSADDFEWELIEESADVENEPDLA